MRWLESNQPLCIFTVVAGQPSDFDDIRRTGDEAQRLLRDLETGPDSTLRASDTSKAKPYSSKQASHGTYTNSSSNNKTTNPVPYIIIIGIIILPIAAIVLNSEETSRKNRPVPALKYRASCGSKYSTSGRWWPVLGPSSRSVLSRVKRQYCGDAYMNAEGSVQVASFGSRQAAEEFSKRIMEAMQVPFRVGRGR